MARRRSRCLSMTLRSKVLEAAFENEFFFNFALLFLEMDPPQAMRNEQSTYKSSTDFLHYVPANTRVMRASIVTIGLRGWSKDRGFCVENFVYSLCKTCSFPHLKGSCSRRNELLSRHHELSHSACATSTALPTRRCRFWPPCGLPGRMWLFRSSK